MSGRVVLTDHQTLVRAGLRAVLENADDIEVVGEAANGAQAVELARSARPDVVLMDIRTLIQEFVARPAHQSVAPERLSALTDRERKVMALVAEGLTNHEIGQRLFMSPATARTHVSRSMVKLGHATAPDWWSSPTRAGSSPASDRGARHPVRPAA